MAEDQESCQDEGPADPEAELERKAQEMAEKALMGVKESVRALKMPSVKASILHRLRSQAARAGAAATPAAPSPPEAPQAPASNDIASTALATSEADEPNSCLAAPAVATDTTPLRPPEECIELCGDEHWFLDEQLLKQQRERVAAAHAEQKILVARPADEIRRICPGGGRLLGAGAVLRLGGAHHGGYGESDIAYAYRQLSRALHPDKNPDVPEAADAFRRLTEASDELRQLLEASRTAVYIFRNTRRSPTIADELLERPQGALFTEALRLLTVVLGLAGEGVLPEGAVAMAAASWERFDSNGKDVLKRWYDSEQLLQLYAGLPVRIAYDCAQKCYRAQFICALSRAAQAEGRRNNGCIRGAWQAVLSQFPEIGLWRALLEKLRAHIWDTPREKGTSKWDDYLSPEPSSWGQLWQSVISEVLPPGPEDAAPVSDPEVKLMVATLWKEVVEWAEGQDDARRALQLFRADRQDDAAPDWAFLPATDLLLTLGDGLVGVTAQGFVGGKGMRRRFEGALRRAKAAALECERAAKSAEAIRRAKAAALECERAAKAAEEAAKSEHPSGDRPVKRRKFSEMPFSETPTCFLCVSSADESDVLDEKVEQLVLKDAQRFGALLRCIRIPDESVHTAKVRAPRMVILEFERRSDAKNVSQQIDGRAFGDKTVRTSFLEQDYVRSRVSEFQKTPSKVLLLKGFALPDIDDVDFESKLLEEARKFGRVRKCIVRAKPDSLPEDSVRAFLAFRLVPDAVAAFASFHGKLRAGRVLRGSFYDEERFKKDDFD